jgi:cysteine desulfurase / selenocysteine lyase
MEHHSNIVPWQMLCEQTGARLKVAPIDDRGELIVEEFERLLGPRTKLVASCHMSNALGTINPVEQIVARWPRARRPGAGGRIAGGRITCRGRAGARLRLLRRDGHKLYGPTGIGVLYGRRALLEAMPPYMGGGDMIASVTFEKSTWNVLPYKFEAGTPNIAGAVGSRRRARLPEPGRARGVGAHEQDLLAYGTAALEGWTACA